MHTNLPARKCTVIVILKRELVKRVAAFLSGGDVAVLDLDGAVKNPIFSLEQQTHRVQSGIRTLCPEVNQERRTTHPKGPHMQVVHVRNALDLLPRKAPRRYLRDVRSDQRGVKLARRPFHEHQQTVPHHRQA